MGRAAVEQVIDGSPLRFCCPGCLYVFQILFNSPDGPPGDFKNTELYRSCVAAGIIPSGEENDVQEASPPRPDTQANSTAAGLDDPRLTQELAIKVEGMWCAACSGLIEEVLRRTKGIVSAQVFFLSDLAQIRYLPHRIEPQAVLGRIERLGYRASLLEEEPEEARERHRLILRLGIASILTVNIMMISFALYGGFFQDIGEDAVRYFSYPLLVLSTPVVFYGGFPILKRAVLGIPYGIVSMDTLIAVGTLSAYGYSAYQMILGSLHLYFDTAAMLVTLVLLGKSIEIKARDKVSGGLAVLHRLSAGKVRLWHENRERWVSVESVIPGDHIVVRAEERIPVDGSVAAGEARLDESALTGEARPMRKVVGDEVMGGSRLIEGELRLRVARVGTESVLGKMIALMQEALSQKNPIEVLADRLTCRLVPIIIVAALGTAIAGRWWGLAEDEALLRALAVLVITCPCALGIATPLAKLASVDVSRTLGVIIRNPAALERIGTLDVMMFDKTGTLTEGNFSLREIVTTGVEEKEALCRVASVETGSDHFLGRAIVRKAREAGLDLYETTGFKIFEGLGVSGSIQSREVFAGNRELMGIHGLRLPSMLDHKAAALEKRGATIVFFGWDGAAQGFLAFGDKLKESAVEALAGLRARGLKLHLVSGDSKATTEAIAHELELDHFAGQVLPADKAAMLEQLQQEGHRVGMIGDGINDAAALAQADVGFAMGHRSGLLQQASDITFLTEDLRRIITVMDLSALTSTVIRQNLFFAFFYNGLGIPLAMSGVLNPLVAVLAMFASSLTVIGNTLRITRRYRN